MVIKFLWRTNRIPSIGDRGMLGAIQPESGFYVGESYVSDVYPEWGESIWEDGSAVVAADDVSELTDGIV
jgi:hypothetical protein